MSWEQRRSEQKEQLTQEIAQLRLEIEKEKKEREAAKMQLSARIERDINGLQERMEQEREELYDKLRQAKATMRNVSWANSPATSYPHYESK